MGFTVNRVLRRVLRRGSEKAVSRRCLERPLVECAPLGVRPIQRFRKGGGQEGVLDKQGARRRKPDPPNRVPLLL